VRRSCECSKTFFPIFNILKFGQVRNMLAIMLDPQFKSLQVVKSLVGHGDAIRLVFKYDLKVIIPLLMTCFVTLNPNVETWTYIGRRDELEDKGNMFEVGTSFEESF